MKRDINVFDYAKEITQALPKGILLTTKAGDKVNSMVIGWGFVGIEWAKPMFIAMVRTGRFTKEQLDVNPEFTINVPLGPVDSKIIKVCGTTTGRNRDKIAEAGLTLVDGQTISVPAVKELPLTLECKVLYQQLQDSSQIPEDVKKRFYPDGVPSSNTGANEDLHVIYHAEITNAYIIE